MTPKANLLVNRFSWLLKYFFIHLSNEKNKSLLSQKIIECFKNFSDYYTGLESETDKIDLLTFFTIAHLYLLNDNLFPYDEVPIRELAKVMSREDLFNVINTLYEIHLGALHQEKEKTAEDYLMECEFKGEESLKSVDTADLNNLAIEMAKFEEKLPKDLVELRQTLEEEELVFYEPEEEEWTDLEETEWSEASEDISSQYLDKMDPLFLWLLNNDYPDLIPAKEVQRQKDKLIKLENGALERWDAFETQD